MKRRRPQRSRERSQLARRYGKQCGNGSAHDPSPTFLRCKKTAVTDDKVLLQTRHEHACCVGSADDGKCAGGREEAVAAMHSEARQWENKARGWEQEVAAAQRASQNTKRQAADERIEAEQRWADERLKLHAQLAAAVKRAHEAGRAEILLQGRLAGVQARLAEAESEVQRATACQREAAARLAAREAELEAYETGRAQRAEAEVAERTEATIWRRQRACDAKELHFRSKVCVF
jgi:hypothetical protein